MRRWIIFLAMTGILFNLTQQVDAEDQPQKRMALYKKTAAAMNIPWYSLAAIDQYERNLRNARKDLPEADGPVSVYFPTREWVGLLNPHYNDKNLQTIRIFGGIGRDGNDDGQADRKDPKDVLYTLAAYLKSYGTGRENLRIALWDKYQRDKTVDIITGYAKVYKTLGKINLDKNAFPLPLKANYTINNTWGDRRSYGGNRIHEGVDIFADYGVPVKATTYGFIDLIGWNELGGWRVGIRSLNNVYHYYGHLKGYAKGIEEGEVVKPGQVIGYVGSSGYGPEGTQGKFPPHLHYGMYKDDGYRERSFDPYSYLKAWERQAKRKK